MASTTTLPRARVFSPLSLYQSFLGLAESVPFSLIQLISRLAIGYVFWKSAQSKLASWTVTEQLFAMQYQVPLLPPDIAAPLATATELVGSILIFLGLFTRLGALALLGVVAVIQLFVFPGHWGEHLLWVSVLLMLATRGAGVFSLDHLAQKMFAKSSS
ncbi:MAG: DoxX family protein [Aestuariivirga sp.]